MYFLDIPDIIEHLHERWSKMKYNNWAQSSVSPKLANLPLESHWMRFIVVDRREIAIYQLHNAGWTELVREKSTARPDLRGPLRPSDLGTRA